LSSRRWREQRNWRDARRAFMKAQIRSRNNARPVRNAPTISCLFHRKAINLQSDFFDLRNHLVSDRVFEARWLHMNLRRDVFQAIADPTRRGILLLLSTQALTAGAIAANFDSSRPAVSKHLRILTACELVSREQIGREIYYHFRPEKMKEVDDFIEPFRRHWEERFNQLDNVLSTIKNRKK
jgi:DNA-binding transcriptional ArsR family regulator